MSRQEFFFNIRVSIWDNPILKLIDTGEYSNGIEYKILNLPQLESSCMVYQPK